MHPEVKWAHTAAWLPRFVTPRVDAADMSTISNEASVRIAEFDGRLWDIRRMLISGDLERARVESSLLTAEAQEQGNDWVTEELDDLWSPVERTRPARSA
jgi:hypothetical protein